MKFNFYNLFTKSIDYNLQHHEVQLLQLIFDYGLLVLLNPKVLLNQNKFKSFMLVLIIVSKSLDQLVQFPMYEYIYSTCKTIFKCIPQHTHGIGFCNIYNAFKSIFSRLASLKIPITMGVVNTTNCKYVFVSIIQFTLISVKPLFTVFDCDWNTVIQSLSCSVKNFELNDIAC